MIGVSAGLVRRVYVYILAADVVWVIYLLPVVRLATVGFDG